MIRRVAAIVLFTAVVCWPEAALAQATTPVQPRDQVVLSGDVTVARGTVVAEVVVFSGSATIAGVVQGDVVVLDGPITIAGQVGGDVIALHGPIRLLDTAQVTGDVMAGGTLARADGAQVLGTVRHDVSVTLAGPIGALGALLVSVAMGVSILLGGLLLLLLAPRGIDRTAAVARSAPAAAAGWGLFAAIAVPVLAVVLAATVLGMPLGLTTLLGLALLWLFGLVAASFAIGRLVVVPPRSRLGALVAGCAIGGAVGLVPILNVAWWTLGGMFGVGLIVVAAWRARSGRADPVGGSGRHRAARHPVPAPVTVGAGDAASPERPPPPSAEG